MFRSLRSLLILLVSVTFVPVNAQTVIPFTSGPIPPCATSTFTANVSGIGTLTPPGWGGWGTYWLNSLTMNITSAHPWTLQVTLTSPVGTSLLLSEFLGAGGQNYTNTTFDYAGFYPSITTGSAPFTGSWTPQGGQLSVFDWENANGTWTITVVDTACSVGGGGTGPGGTWTPGMFNGGGANGGFAFGFDPGPPPCMGWIPSDIVYICSGGSVDILGYYTTANPWYSYSITLASGGMVPDPSNVTAAGTYWIDATDPWDGCWYSAMFQIIVTPQFSLGPDQVVDVCTGSGPVNLAALFTLTGIAPSWTLDGAPITTATAAAATAAGSYRLIGQNNGCSDTAFVTLNITPGVVLGPDQTVSTCPGTSIDLTTLYTTIGAVATWSFGGAPFATPTAASTAGVYTIDVTSGTGCTATADVTLTVQALASLGADQSVDLCSNATFDLTTLYTTTGLVVEWTLAGAPVLAPAAVTVAGMYRLVASNGSGCSDTAFVSVNAVASPALGPDVAASICGGDAVDLTASFITTGLSTSWTSAGAPVADPTSVSTSGTYALVATNSAGCSDMANVNVTVSANPVLGPDQAIFECDGVVMDLTALYATGTNTTAWTLNGSPVADPASVTIGGAYMLTATNAAGCSATTLVSLAFDPAPALGADVQAAICEGSTFDLSAVYITSGSAAAWTLNGGVVSDPTAVAIGGDYQLVVTNAAGCTDMAMVALSVDPNPSLGADLSFTLCQWQTVDLTTVFPVGGMTALYTLDGAVVADPTAVHDAGTYLVSVTNATGCTDEAAASIVNVECLCEADFRDNARCMQDPVLFTLLADSAVLSARWNFNGSASTSNSIDALVRFTEEESVLVTLEATLSCGVVVVERTVFVEDCSDSCSVWIPNSFTPDNDGVNDTWVWTGECGAQEFSMEVFDRFGHIIFASNDPYKGWDGLSGSGLSPSGVYAYRVGYRLPYQDRKEVVGSVTLVR